MNSKRKRSTGEQEFMEILFEPLGDYAPKLHAIVVDYQDRSGHDCFQELRPFIPQNMSITDAAKHIKDEMEQNGNIVSYIWEILAGYTYSEVETMMARNKSKAVKYLRPLYAPIDRVDALLEIF